MHSLSKKKPVKEQAKMIALKAFVICQNKYYREIKAGDDISDVPKLFHENLKTEGVLPKGEE